MKFGVQLYGLRRLYRSNPKELFDCLSQMGYRGVEPCVSFNADAEAIWAEETFRANEPVWHSFGLRADSCHVFADDIPAALPRMAAFAQMYGVRQLVFNCPRPLNQDACAAFAETCLAAASQLKENGVALLLHNGDHDSAVRVEGKSAYEWILDACGETLGAQPDVGWLLYGGVDPVRFLERKAAQVQALHYKDILAPADPSAPAAQDVPLGTGKLDVLACYRFACAAGIPQIVDQDTDRGDILTELGASLALLRSFDGGDAAER